ncbi:APC family permease [Arthrobacter sp. D2-10]
MTFSLTGVAVAADASLRRTLKLRHVVLFGLAYTAPLAVVNTYGPIAHASHGLVPAAYVVGIVAMLFTAYAYSQMARRVPSSGSAYAYVRASMGAHAGWAVGWTVLLDYLFLPAVEAVINAMFLATIFPAVPHWAWIVVYIALVTVTNIAGVKVAAVLNYVLVGLPLLLLGVFSFLAVKSVLAGEGVGAVVSTLPFHSPDVGMAAVLSGASLVIVSFLGFDAVTTLAEETRDPRRTIPKAILIVTLIAGLLFIAISYLMFLVHPNHEAFTNPNAPALEIFMTVGGPALVSIFLVCRTAGGLAATIASQGTVSRIFFALGRDGILPRRLFSYIHPRFQTPMGAMLVVTALVLTLALSLSIDTLFSMISFGALTAFAFVNLSVVVLVFFKEGRRGLQGTLLYLCVPLVGFMVSFVLWLGLSTQAKILGGLWVLVGIVYLVIRTRGFTRQMDPNLGFDTPEAPEVPSPQEARSPRA